MFPAQLSDAQLLAMIQRAARRALTRFPGRDDDLNQEVQMHLWQQVRQGMCPDDPVHRERWCSRVAWNKALDHLRRRRHDPLRLARTGSDTDGPSLVEGLPDSHAVGLTHDPGAEIDRRALFSEGDLVRIASWGPVRRLVILCLAELGHKVPSPLWEEWCRKAGVATPLPHFVLASGDAEKIAALTDLLGVTRNTVYQIRHRHFQACLASLDYVQGLRHDYWSR